MEQYTVTGMSCAACSARVEKAVAKVEGVTSCSVSLLTNSMGVSGTADAAAIIEAVEHAGYGAAKKGDTASKETSPCLCRIFNCAHVFFHGTYDVELAAACFLC